MPVTVEAVVAVPVPAVPGDVVLVATLLPGVTLQEHQARRPKKRRVLAIEDGARYSITATSATTSLLTTWYLVPWMQCYR